MSTKEYEFYSFVPPAGFGTGLPNAPVVLTDAAAPTLILPVALTVPGDGTWLAVLSQQTTLTRIRFGSSAAMGSSIGTDVQIPLNQILRFRVSVATQYASTFGGTGSVFFWKANP